MAPAVKVKVQPSRASSHPFSPAVILTEAPLCDWPRPDRPTCGRGKPLSSHTPRGRWTMVAKDGAIWHVCSIHYQQALSAGLRLDRGQASAVKGAAAAAKVKASQPKVAKVTTTTTTTTSRGRGQGASRPQPSRAMLPPQPRVTHAEAWAAKVAKEAQQQAPSGADEA